MQNNAFSIGIRKLEDQADNAMLDSAAFMEGALAPLSDLNETASTLVDNPASALTDCAVDNQAYSAVTRQPKRGINIQVRGLTRQTRRVWTALPQH